MFVVSLHYLVDLSEVDQHIPAHIDYLNLNYERGNFLASGRKEPRTGGVILATAPSRDLLDEILADDPFFVAGIASYEITEFVPTMFSPGLRHLENL